MVDDGNAEDLFKKYDIVLSCVDNIEARNVLNRAHIKTKTPLIDAGVNAFSGYILPIISGYACYNCVYPTSVPKEALDNSIIGATAGMVGCMQALETIKTLLDLNGDFFGKMLFIDLMELSFQTIEVKKSESCICSTEE